MDWKSLYLLVKPIAAGQLRTFLAGASGYLAAQHVIPGDQKSAFVSIGMSVAAYGVAALWSLVSKWLAAKTVQKALLTRSPMSATVTVGEALKIVDTSPKPSAAV